MDIFGLLLEDHARARAFADGLGKNAEGVGGESWSRFREEWEIHARAEEKFLYPCLESDAGARGLAQAAREGNRRVRGLLKEMEGRGPWGARRVAELKRALADLEAMEKRRLYRRAARLLGPEEAEHLALEVEGFREELMLLIRAA